MGKGRASTYLRVSRVELVFSASETCLAPSSPRELMFILQVGVERKR